MKVSRQGSKGSCSVPNYSSSTYNFTEYDMEFDAKITRRRFIWSVGYNFGIRSSGGVLLNLASNSPEVTTYVNINKTNKDTVSPVLGYTGLWSKLRQLNRLDILQTGFISGSI
ncbi:uncharacterized protein N7483_002355 [Penicillium malachiteum]|uniref:uncharacterized protein n=1 Tax=Penicillium malachiteum TaxID=1324776 RepID=UPI002548BB0B|nr:uncharacterized protein N7483_002355 [Penicillium malachiteum]KAJ5737230.1 hypothetical protein N7483_002355 [Penicillium malachiteum]